MSVSGEVHLVLDCLEELLRGFCSRVIVYAECIDFQNLAIEYLFRGADVPNACQEFVKVIASAGALQKIVVHGKAFDKVLAQYLRGPDAELHAAVGIDRFVLLSCFPRFELLQKMQQLNPDSVPQIQRHCGCALKW